MRLSLNLLGLTRDGGDFSDVVRVAQRAEEAGFHQLSLGEHLALIPRGFDKYPGQRFPRPAEFPYYEPLTALAALALATTHIRLSTNVLVTPLRPALLLAKQIATLDAISGGRTELAWGVGWHEEEFEANGSSFRDRSSILEEQVAVCRAVWGEPPASHRGPRISFDDLYSVPTPPQNTRLPIWFGMNPSPRGLERIARLADGWAPLPMSLEDLRAAILDLRAELVRAGRDPAGFPVRATLLPVLDRSGRVDVDASIATISRYGELGVTMIICDVQQYCPDLAAVDDLLDRFSALDPGEPRAGQMPTGPVCIAPLGPIRGR